VNFASPERKPGGSLPYAYRANLDLLAAIAAD
jgi:hypothetical protein